MTNWNPSAPDVIGVEFLPDRDDGTGSSTPPGMGLADSLVGAAMTLPSSTTETITNLRVLLSDPDASGGAPGKVLAEILTAGAEVPTGVATATFRPNGQANNTGWLNQAASSTVYTAVNGATVDTSRYMEASSPGGSGAAVDLEFDTAGALAGKRIMAIRMVVAGLITSGFDAMLTTSIVGSSTEYVGFSQFAGPAPYVVTSSDLGEMYLGDGLANPIYPWTVAQLQALDAGTARFRFQIASLGAATLRVFQIYLEVDYCDENRLAVATVAGANAGGGGGDPYGWQQSATLRTPTGGTHWSKANGTDFTVLLRRYRMPGHLAGWNNPRMKAPYLRGVAESIQPAGVATYAPTLTVAGGVSSLGPALNRVLGVVLLTSAPAQSVDSQPYAIVTSLDVTSAGGPWQQEISGASAQDYGGVTVPVAHDSDPGLDDLTVELRRRSDSALLATATITQAEVDAQGPSGSSPWTIMQAPFAAPVTLAAATQYYLAFSTAGSGTWSIPVLDGADTITVTGAGSYGNETDVVTRSFDYTIGDAAVNVFVLPDAVADVAATAAAVPLNDPPGGCALTGLPYVAVTWTATALGGTFGAYDVQRLGVDGVTWERIAWITDEAVEEFDDFEARLGVQESYRVRVVTASGIESPWSATVTATAAAAGCGYTFTSNEAPEMSVAYADVYDRAAERRYRFPEADEVVVRRMYGRDFQVAFRPISRRGVTFDRTLLIAALTAPAAGVGPAAADALRDLAHSTLSYVAVRDEQGNRWFGSITVPDLSVRQPSNLHRVTVTFVETTATPSTPDAVAP